MKLNWGQSIAVFYILFMVIMITMVVKASKNSVELVQENYYKKDLNYEAFRTSRSNGEAVSEEVDVKYDPAVHLIRVSLPETHEIKDGQIQLYRPSDHNLDHTFELQVDNKKKVELDTKKLPKGLWRVHLSWSTPEANYHIERTLTL